MTAPNRDKIKENFEIVFSVWCGTGWYIMESSVGSSMLILDNITFTINYMRINKTVHFILILLIVLSNTE